MCLESVLCAFSGRVFVSVASWRSTFALKMAASVPGSSGSILVGRGEDIADRDHEPRRGGGHRVGLDYKSITRNFFGS